MIDSETTQSTPTTFPLISICDGTAHHAKYLLRLDEHDMAKLDPRRTGPPPFPLIADGIYCFTDRDLDRAEAYLKERGIEKYTTEALPAPKNWSCTKGVIYESCEHVTAHIEQGIEPDSMVIPQLCARLAEAEARVAAAEAKAAAAEAKIAELGELKARLQSLEEEARRKPGIAGEPEK